MELSCFQANINEIVISDFKAKKRKRSGKKRRGGRRQSREKNVAFVSMINRQIT